MDASVAYWVYLAQRDMQSANALLIAGDTANALMLCQQALEKGLKAIIQSQSLDLPPRTHNLPRLLDLAGLMQLVPEAMVETLVEVDPYIIEGRYPVTTIPEPPDPAMAADLLRRAQEALQWLLARLK